MEGSSPPRLRTRRGLVFTVFPAIAVLAVLGALLAVQHHASVVEDRHAETRALAAAAATNARRFADDQFATLSAIAAAPTVRAGRAGEVTPYLRVVARSARFTAGVGLVGANGRLRASSDRIPPDGVSVRDRPYVRAALAEGLPSASDVLIGRTVAWPVVTFAYPVFSLAGQRDAVIAGSVRLDQVDQALRRLLYAPGAGETILDGTGHVIVGPEPVRGLQRPPASYPVAEMRRRRHGIIDRVQTAQGSRLLGFSEVPGTSWLVVVDQDHGEVIGPLDRALWAEIVALLLLAALGVAVTLSAARRLDRLDAARDEALAEQRDIALQLQRSLLPDLDHPPTPALRVHASYAPAQGAMAVGGDWYDLVEIDDGRVALSVGDVAGHGLGAAAVMGQLRSAARTLALGHASPGAVLTQLDRYAATLDGPPLATVVFGVLDPAAATLRYAVAGHPPPLLLRADGAAELLTDARSPLLGVEALEERPEAEVRLRPGDTLLFYTDGLIERPGSTLDAGIKRLIERATAAHARDPQTLAAELIDGVGEPRRDDTAVLCVRLPAAPA